MTNCQFVERRAYIYKGNTFFAPGITDLEIQEVVDTLKSGWITTDGRTRKFGHEISEYIRTNKAVCLNSQTSAAELTLRILGIGPDEVIVPAYTYTARHQL